MPEKPVEIVLMAERPLARDDEPSEFDVAVEIRCRATEAGGSRGSPVDLALVIDRSGSMAGDKLAAAKRSCLDIFHRLAADDLFSVVTFNKATQVVVNPQTPRAEVEGRINAITSGGLTDLSGGWYQGLLE